MHLLVHEKHESKMHASDVLCDVKSLSRCFKLFVSLCVEYAEVCIIFTVFITVARHRSESVVVDGLVTAFLVQPRPLHVNNYGSCGGW